MHPKKHFAKSPSHSFYNKKRSKQSAFGDTYRSNYNTLYHKFFTFASIFFHNFKKYINFISTFLEKVNKNRPFSHISHPFYAFFGCIFIHPTPFYSPLLQKCNVINWGLSVCSNFNLSEMASHQGLSKNGRGSRGAGGEVAPIDVSKWRVLKASPRWRSCRGTRLMRVRSLILRKSAHTHPSPTAPPSLS